MVVALVGRAYSRKHDVAVKFAKVLPGLLIKPVVLQDNDKAFSVRYTKDGQSWGISEQQLAANGYVIYVTDDPRDVPRFRYLHAAYAVVYVDCAYGAILKRAGRYSGVTKRRMTTLAGSMKRFERELQYSMYLNTTNITDDVMDNAIAKFSELVREGEYRTLEASNVSSDWIKIAREDGYYIGGS